MPFIYFTLDKKYMLSNTSTTSDIKIIIPINLVNATIASNGFIITKTPNTHIIMDETSINSHFSADADFKLIAN